MRYDITIFPGTLADADKVVFCGYFGGGRRMEGSDTLSRVHRQPDRIHWCGGIHPALSSSESMGRYYVAIWHEEV